MYGQLDIRILQDLVIVPKSKKTIQLSLDFINIGNFFNSDWGVRKYASASGYFQPISYLGGGKYQFDPSLKETFIASPDLPSRWQMQFGLRYIF